MTAPLLDRLAEAIHSWTCEHMEWGDPCRHSGPSKADYKKAAALRPLIEAEGVKREAKALREAADGAEWTYRSMSFSCGSGTSETRLHPVGEWLRTRADRIEDK